jgi:hypothetical protein
MPGESEAGKRDLTHSRGSFFWPLSLAKEANEETLLIVKRDFPARISEGRRIGKQVRQMYYKITDAVIEQLCTVNRYLLVT